MLSNFSSQLLGLEVIDNSESIYQFKNPVETPWQIAHLASRWQAQLGNRFGF
jgi:uncharacterized protein YerC